MLLLFFVLFFCLFVFFFFWEITKMSQCMTKSTKWNVHPAKTQISLGIHPVWSVFAVSMKKAWVLSDQLRALQTLIRLGRCPDWSEFCWVHMPFCRLCHALAESINTFWMRIVLSRAMSCTDSDQFGLMCSLIWVCTDCIYPFWTRNSSFRIIK